MSDAAPVIELYPHESGDWCWRRTDQEQGLVTGFKTRGEALADARKANGRSSNPIFNEGGTKVGDAIVDGDLRIVLLRADGTLYGEIDAPKSDSIELPKRVRVTAAESTTTADTD